MAITIPQAVSQMLAIVDKLCVAYPKKRFTLDGRLVGDIGEVLVEAAYDLTLYEDIKKHHDAETGDGRKVQIKATMKNSLTFPCGHVPDYYLGVQLHKDGTFTEIFNGPGEIAKLAVQARAASKTNLHSVSISALKKLQAQVPLHKRIPKRGATTKVSTVRCLGCQSETPKVGRRECPACGHQFKGNGWDGIDAHWRSKHKELMSYEDFWETLCQPHREGGRGRKAR